MSIEDAVIIGYLWGIYHAARRERTHLVRRSAGMILLLSFERTVQVTVTFQAPLSSGPVKACATTIGVCQESSSYQRLHWPKGWSFSAQVKSNKSIRLDEVFPLVI